MKRCTICGGVQHKEEHHAAQREEMLALMQQSQSDRPLAPLTTGQSKTFNMMAKRLMARYRCPHCMTSEHWISECADAMTADRQLLPVYLEEEKRLRSASQEETPSSASGENREVRSSQRGSPRTSTGSSAVVSSVIKGATLFDAFRKAESHKFSFTLETPLWEPSLVHFGLLLLLLALLVAAARFAWSKLRSTMTAQTRDERQPHRQQVTSRVFQDPLCVQCNRPAVSTPDTPIDICETCLQWGCHLF